MIKPKKRGRRRKKKGPNKAILFLVFSGTFILCFYVSSFIIANYIPSVELPVITNDEEEVATVNSNDFKKRIDPRLQQIEVSEKKIVRMQKIVKKPKRAVASAVQSKKPKKEVKVKNNSNTSNEFMPDEILFNNKPPKLQAPRPQLLNKQRAYAYDHTPTPPRPGIIIERKDNRKAEAKRAITPPPLPPATVVKLYVGEFSNPRDAKKLSDELTHSNLNITPFIKEINGKYSLQVGTFTSRRQAKDMAKKLKRRKLKPKLMNEDILSY